MVRAAGPSQPTKALGAAAAPPEAAPAARASFARTTLCKFYSKGVCKRGAGCKFAHGAEQLQALPDLYRTELCFDYLRSGTCRAASDCRFAHSPTELRHAATAGAGRGGAPEGDEAAQLELLRRQLRLVQARVQEMLQTVAEHTRPAGAAPPPDGKDGPGRCRGAAAPELAAGAGSPAGAEAGGGCKGAKAAEGPSDFSRQTTAEDGGEEDASSDEEEDSSDDEAPAAPVAALRRPGAGADGSPRAAAAPGRPAAAAPGPWQRGVLSGEALGLGAAAGVALLVRNTFVEMRPLRAASPRRERRSQSAPGDSHRPGWSSEE